MLTGKHANEDRTLDSTQSQIIPAVTFILSDCSAWACFKPKLNILIIKLDFKFWLRFVGVHSDF